MSNAAVRHLDPSSDAWSDGLPEYGMDAEDAYRRVHEELEGDDPPGANLGSFVSPRVDPWAERLIVENLGKNFVCDSEYRQSRVIHDRMVEALARLYNAPDGAERCGTATAGSSEAILLALLAHKLTWRSRRLAEGKPAECPNLVVFADCHVCWDKFGCFFDVEIRKAPIRRAGAGYSHAIEDLREHIDENTICVGAVVGTTYTGASHPVAAINALLEQLAAERGWDIPIHVDAATGGFLLPFMPAGERVAWDFRLSRVRSINASGHKYGLVFPGLGWLLFRDASCLPREAVFAAPYLGGPLDTFTLNFSRSAAPIVAQYYNFVRHGRAGFRAVVARCGELARSLADRLAGIDGLELVSDLELPIVCFRPAPGFGVDAFALSRRLRERGWVVPAYAMPEGAADDVVLRVVVHERFDAGMVARLARAIAEATRSLSPARVDPLRGPASEGSIVRDALRGLPSFLAYGHIGLLGIVDCLMIGRLGVTELAAVGFAANVLAPFYVLATGVAFVLPPLIARERRPGGATTRLHACLAAQAAVVAVSVAALLLLGGRLDVFHQPAAVELAARPYLVGMAFALLPVAAFAALREYALALGRPELPAGFAAMALVLKIALGAALLGPLGAFGAALATALGYGAAVAAFALLLARRGLFTRPGGQPLRVGETLAQGLAVSLQQLFELGSFYFAGIMAGWLGASALAGHSVGLNVVNGAALLSLSIAQSTSAQVSRRAAADRGAAARAARGGVALAFGTMSVVAPALLLARGELFQTAPELSALALFIAPALLADGVQMALTGALRGLLDTRFLAVMTFVCWWLFCLPLAYVLAFVNGYGVYGIWAAFAATLILTAVILTLRLALLVGGATTDEKGARA